MTFNENLPPELSSSCIDRVNSCCDDRRYSLAVARKAQSVDQEIAKVKEKPTIYMWRRKTEDQKCYDMWCV